MRLSFLILLIVLACQAMAQQITLHGSVVDSKTLDKLLGAHVYHKGMGVTTDIDGNFVMKVNWSDTLHVTMVGYDSLRVIVKDTAKYQTVILSMKERATLLNNVSVIDYYKANTLLRLPEDRNRVYPVPGVQYPEGPRRENYRLGVAGAIFSPMTAVNRLVDKDYKQRKRVHYEEIERRSEDADYVRARKKIYEALRALDDDLDEYYLLDFLRFVGLSVDGANKRSTYDLVQILKGQIDRYNEYRKQKLENDATTDQ